MTLLDPLLSNGGSSSTDSEVLDSVEEERNRQFQTTMLREELLLNQRARNVTFITTLTIGGVIWGFLLQGGSQIAQDARPGLALLRCLLPMFALYGVTIISCFLCRIYSEKVKYLGTYMEVFLGFQWEIESSKMSHRWWRAAHITRPMVLGYILMVGGNFFGVGLVILGILEIGDVQSLDTRYAYSIMIFMDIANGLSVIAIGWVYSSGSATLSWRFVKAWREIKDSPNQNKKYIFGTGEFPRHLILFFFLSVVLSQATIDFIAFSLFETLKRAGVKRMPVRFYGISLLVMFFLAVLAYSSLSRQSKKSLTQQAKEAIDQSTDEERPNP